jgi:uncharacterized protein YfdQ (DUF2303 family)
MSEIEAIEKLVTGAALVPSILTDAWGRQHAFIPAGLQGFRREDITPKRSVKIDPAFIDQLVNIDQADSLVEYVNRFKTDDTVILADLDELQIWAIIDYHKAKSSGPGLNEHHAILTLTHSAEWETWTSISGRMYDQKAFSRMIDINSDDIIQPAAAELLEQVMDLEMSTSVSVKRKLEATGSSRGTGNVARQTTGTVLPPFFILSIPVFTGEPKVDVRAMTLDSQDGNSGKISLGLELVRTRIIIETELARMARNIASATSVPVMMGSLSDTQS